MNKYLVNVRGTDNVLEIQFIGDNDSNVEKTNCNLTNMDYIHERKNLAPRRLHEKRQLAKMYSWQKYIICVQFTGCAK